MKKHRLNKLFMCIPLFWLLGCSNSNKVNKNQSEPDNSIKITTTKTSSYCGGAKPPDELLDELREPKVYPKAKLFIRKGSKNEFQNPYFKKVETDSAGKVSISLPKGVYAVVFDNKSDVDVYNELIKTVESSSSYDTLDIKCLDRYFTKPDGIITVTDSIQTVTINRHFPCEWQSVPCARYTGSLPPTIQQD